MDFDDETPIFRVVHLPLVYRIGKCFNLASGEFCK